MAGGLWAPYKELFNTVHTAIALRQPQSYYSLENVLKKHKPDMLSLLKNPARNSAHRSQVQNATKEGLTIANISHQLTLPQDFIDESLILSDILDLNEIVSVELLLAGEQHQPDFPSLSRGLVAVLLYYDGRRNLVVSLRSLIQACEGVSWTLGLEPRVVALVTNFVQELFQDDMIGKMIRLLKAMNVEKELENLGRGKAIKDAHHRQQIIDLIKETYQALRDCLVYWACQNPLPKDPLLKILLELKKVPALDEGHTPLDSTSLALFFTFLVSLRVSESDPSGLDSSLVDDRWYPFLTDANSISLIHQEVTRRDPQSPNKSVWSNTALEAAVKFSWAVFLRECASLESFKDCEEPEDDENLIDEAIDLEAFQFFRQSVVASSNFFHEEWFVKAIHHVLTSYIHLMPVKITELRNQGDEVARDEILRLLRSAPATPKRNQNFGELMLLLGSLYSSDPLDLNLSQDFWPSNELSSQALQHRTLSLYKFIHQCSDLLPPSLFHSFMFMLCGLSSSSKTAHQCFELLKSNSPSQGGGGPSAAISFDHFFNSLRQYYVGLKQAGGPSHTPTGCAISPQELDGLIIVLKLISIIVDQDENARGMIYDNQTWLPVATLFGLIGCPISRQLKSQIFLTLSSFAKTPDIAASMWSTIEIAQILNTSPLPASGVKNQFGLAPVQQEGSLLIELEEIESAAEEYSETRSFLVLLDSLTNIPVPLSLGADHRVPGFQPYLEFVRDIVFLKFDSRGYKDPQEKWMVASSSLKVLLKLLSSHELSVDDFVEQMYEVSQGHYVTLPRRPGFAILLHLLNDSALLRKLLFIIGECCGLLADVESYTSEIETVVLLSLKMLESALSKEDEFFALLRSNTSHSVMATPLDNLLFGINPRSGQADHYLNIAKYISLTQVSSEVALVAVRILGLASRSPVIARDVLNSLSSDKESCANILHGFVEHLEYEEGEEPTNEREFQRQLKEDILKLLVLCVSRGSQNIALLLLGFVQVNEHFGSRPSKLSDTIVQDPGVLGAPKTCLHSVLSLVRVGSHVQSRGSPIGCHLSHPKLAELCYKLLYLLTANREFGQPVLRYLRNNHDYFYVQLSNIPFPWLPPDLHDNEGEAHMTCYNQMSWVLRSVAIELKMSTASNQRSHAQRLTTLLLKTPIIPSQEELMATWGGEWPGAESDCIDERRKILLLLDLMEFSSLSTPPLQLQFFDQSRTEEVIRSCEIMEGEGVAYADVKTLHRLLMNELSGLQGSAAVAQKPYILTEIHDILDVVVKRNSIREVLYCRQVFIESWQQVVEVLMGVVSEEGKEKLRIDVLFELIQDLLLKVENCEANNLTAIALSAVFTLMSHLRQTLSSQFELDCQTLSPASIGPLQSILRRLLDSLLQCPSGMQRLRSYLYATLLCYLHMTKERESAMETHRGGLWRLEHDANLAAANLSILSACGENLMDTVCRDSCTGHDIPKMLSLSILDSVIYLDKHSVWLKFMISRGYLLTIVSSLQQDDESLRKMLQPNPDALRPLYVYESKMAFLILVASTTLGARELVSKNCVAMLSECNFIDQRPLYRNDPVGGASGFVPSVWTRYLQLYLPVLRFLLSLISTSGSQQKQATSQVIDFIATHIEVFVSVLKESYPPVSMATLQELALVSAVISQCRAGQDWMLDINHPHTASLLHLQNLILALVPFYLLPSKWMLNEPEGRDQFGAGHDAVDGPLWEEQFNLSQKVCSSLVLYCQNAVTMGGTVDLISQPSRILFSPNLSKASSGIVPGSVSSSSPLSLALLVSAIEETNESYFSVSEKLQHLKGKLDYLKNMTSDEMKHLFSDISNEDTSQLSPLQLQQQLKSALNRLIANKEQQLGHFIYIMEHLLSILWYHLHFYLVYYQPSEQYPIPQITNRPIRNLQGGNVTMESSRFDVTQSSAGGITLKDIEELKLTAVHTLNDSFFKKILDVSEKHMSSSEQQVTKIGFIDALVRRMRKLLKLRAAVRPVLNL